MLPHTHTRLTIYLAPLKTRQYSRDRTMQENNWDHFPTSVEKATRVGQSQSSESWCERASPGLRLQCSIHTNPTVGNRQFKHQTLCFDLSFKRKEPNAQLPVLTFESQLNGPFPMLSWENSRLISVWVWSCVWCFNRQITPITRCRYLDRTRSLTGVESRDYKSVYANKSNCCCGKSVCRSSRLSELKSCAFNYFCFWIKIK